MTPEEEFRDLRQENKMLREIIQQQQELIEQVRTRWEKGPKSAILQFDSPPPPPQTRLEAILQTGF